MTYRGMVKRGVVVFSKATPLKDGTPVRVEPIPSRKKADSPKKKQSFRPVGQWQGEAGELERLLAQVQQTRDSDMALERDSWR
jgi:hypothetical protein